MTDPRPEPDPIGDDYRRPDELPTPALVLDAEVLTRNLERMAERMRRLGVALRPHVKTHKCPRIAARQQQLGAVGITVSTLAEARVFAAQGFTDLTWAFPTILNRMPEIRELTGEVRAKDGTLRLLVDSAAAIDALESRVPDAHVWLKVDCGYHRAGVDPTSAHAVDLARRLHDSPTLAFDGILTHAGHAYKAATRDDLLQVAADERRVMVDFAARLRDGGIEVPGVSVGSTPTMSVVTDLAGITEARPGNYAFYDFTQCQLGSCTVGDCALTVVASVVSSSSDHCVVDAGALSLSQDPGPDWVRPPSFGRIFRRYEDGVLEPEMRVVALSQEHGIVNAPLPVGTRVRILMNHSCLAVPNFAHYAVVRHDRVIDRWQIRR